MPTISSKVHPFYVQLIPGLIKDEIFQIMFPPMLAHACNEYINYKSFWRHCSSIGIEKKKTKIAGA